ncbi:MAG: hybrid sensor histidine kinase/response regulator [Flavobacteriaceae bacterium]
MYPKSNNIFTLKIVVSYLVLGLLALLAGIFIYFQFKNYTATQNIRDDNLKLLKTNTLFAELYEAENLSKLATQSNKTKNLQAYARKVDSMASIIDTLKLLASNNTQTNKLDSIQKLLLQKVYNSAELRKLKVQNKNSTSIDSLLKTFHKMEVDMGRITPETFVPNFNTLPLETQKSIREYVALLNKNIPSESGKNTDSNTLDSILQVSKSFLQEAKTENLRIERSVVQKELEIYRTDLELSHKLRSIISSLEQEIILNAYQDNVNKQQVLRKSIWLAGGAVFLGLLVGIIFTFLISKDFWRIQEYRKQLENEKKYSESLLKSREQLISTVSHDLRTPLSTIGGYAELMKHSNLNAIQQTYLKNVTSATTYVEQLANDLLDYSKLENGKITVEKIPFVPFNLIEETANSVKTIYPKKPVELKLEISAELKKTIVSDPFRVRQILSNLIGNAFKFTHEGWVQINASLEKKAQNAFVKIEIIDSGIGIDPKDQKVVFEEFRQAENTNTYKLEGYGLGLTISKKLTELLGGTLTLASKKKEGSSFTLRFPYELSRAQVQIQGPTGFRLNRELSLLIFDDNDSLLGLLREVCKTHSITAHIFSCFTQLKKNANLDYDIVLTDIQMPKVNGFEVVKTLKNTKHYSYQNQPIIAMTGQLDVNKSIYSEAGFDHVLEKPFSSAQLMDALALVSNFNIYGNPNPNGYKAIPNVKSKNFSVDTVAAFLENPEALHNVLQTFIANTRKNLSLLIVASKSNNSKEIRNISHKMLPMFTQLNVHDAVPLLKKLEKTPENTSCKKEIAHLKKITLKLEASILRYLAKLPVDIG